MLDLVKVSCRLHFGLKSFVAEWTFLLVSTSAACACDEGGCIDALRVTKYRGTAQLSFMQGVATAMPKRGPRAVEFFIAIRPFETKSIPLNFFFFLCRMQVAVECV